MRTCGGCIAEVNPALAAGGCAMSKADNALMPSTGFKALRSRSREPDLHGLIRPLQLENGLYWQEPVLNGRPIKLWHLFKCVQQLGGSECFANPSKMSQLHSCLDDQAFVDMNEKDFVVDVRSLYEQYLLPFEPEIFEEFGTALDSTPYRAASTSEGRPSVTPDTPKLSCNRELRALQTGSPWFQNALGDKQHGGGGRGRTHTSARQNGVVLDIADAGTAHVTDALLLREPRQLRVGRGGVDTAAGPSQAALGEPAGRSHAQERAYEEIEVSGQNTGEWTRVYEGYSLRRVMSPPGFEVFMLLPGYTDDEVQLCASATRLVVSAKPADALAARLWGIRRVEQVVLLPHAVDPLQTSCMLSLHGQLYCRFYDAPSPRHA